MLSRIVMTAVLAWMLGCGAMSGAQAQQPISSGQQAANPSGWTFNIAPYVWMPSIDLTNDFNLPPTARRHSVQPIRRSDSVIYCPT